MDFRHLIVTCLFSMLRLPFDNQKVKENYAIFLKKITAFLKNALVFDMEFYFGHIIIHTSAQVCTYV